MTFGGLRLESLREDVQRELQLPVGQLALRAKHVGQYGDHAVAKRAGFLEDDILVAIDGDQTPLTESGLMAKLLQTKRPGEKIMVTVLRAEQRVEFQLVQQ